tara:strand:+ start:660 stop:983 length:324 start_codon:yes stop_codon:yes gene_type:complete
MTHKVTIRKEVDEGITSCISGYLGYITQPLRESLTKDLCKRVGRILEETSSSEEEWIKGNLSTVLKSIEGKWEWRYKEQLSLIRTLEANAVELRKEIRALKKEAKSE